MSKAIETLKEYCNASMYAYYDKRKGDYKRFLFGDKDVTKEVAEVLGLDLVGDEMLCNLTDCGDVVQALNQAVNPNEITFAVVISENIN